MKEFKVIVGADTANTHVLVDNQPVGMIQDIKFHVSVGAAPTVEIVFPDLRPFGAEHAQKIQEQVEKLKDLPQVKISLAKVEMPKLKR